MHTKKTTSDSWNILRYTTQKHCIIITTCSIYLSVPEGSSTSPDLLMSESWEWREGRLLAYELILKFLIINHIHYVFPTFVLPVSKASASSSSVDERLISRWVFVMDVSLHYNIINCKIHNKKMMKKPS